MRPPPGPPMTLRIRLSVIGNIGHRRTLHARNCKFELALKANPILNSFRLDARLDHCRPIRAPSPAKRGSCVPTTKLQLRSARGDTMAVDAFAGCSSPILTKHPFAQWVLALASTRASSKYRFPVQKTMGFSLIITTT
jgi:hypothetical protein